MDISFEPLPLVIGVTGHRDLREADIPLLRKELHAIFERLEDDYANPPPFLERMRRRLPGALLDKVLGLLPVEARKRPGATPMIVLSALAEGADQLVAQVAIERGLRVIAPLPLPPEEYRRDFELDPIRSSALKDFDEWMARLGIQKLIVGETDNLSEGVRSFGEERNLRYRGVGAFIARHCDVLIALWDGKTGTGTGGTAEIVGFKRHGIPLNASGDAHASLDAPEIGPVIHIVTPRATKEDTAGAVSVQCWGVELIERCKALEAAAGRRSATAAEKKRIKEEMAAIEPDYLRWKSFEAPIKLSHDFNREAALFLLTSAGRAKAEKSFLELFEVNLDLPEKAPGVVQAKATALHARAIAPHYCELYAVADRLAQNWQGVFRRDWLLLFAFGLFAFGCFEAFSHLAPIAHSHLGPTPLEWRDMPLISWIIDLGLLSLYILAFVAIFALYFRAILRRHQERFLDYRALAEALRVAAFWSLAGIEGAADAYPIKMPRELAWVKTCLLVQELFDKAAPAGGTERAALNWASYDWIRRIWIEGQLKYFRKSRGRHDSAAGWRERWSTWILVAVAILAASLLLLVSRVTVSRWEWTHDLFLFTIGMLPGVAAIFVGYSEKLAFNAQARQYDRMAEVFERARQILPRTLVEVNADLVPGVLQELGTEAMRDNAEWVSIYRQRPISLPQS